jgi:hypothetical protein
MSLEALQKALNEPRIDLTDRELLERIFIMLQDRDAKWVSQKEYADRHSIDRTTAYRLKPYLRRIGAIKNEGKMTRYNPNIAPTGERKRT